MTTPLDFAVQGDPMAEIGGLGAAAIEPGKRFRIAGKQVSFEPLAADLLLPVGRGGVNLARLVEDRSALTICLHTVFQSPGAADRQGESALRPGRHAGVDGVHDAESAA